MQAEILLEDNSILVVYKPAGMAVQTKRFNEQDLESYLKNYRAKKGEEPYIGLIHRLDQPVEGVMVFAKTKEAAANLSEQVREHGAGKHYYAVSLKKDFLGDAVEAGKDGSLKSKAMADLKELHQGDQGTLTDYIAFDPRTNMSHIVPAGAAKRFQAKKAVLDYQVIYEDEEKLCFDILLHTGRHHQIRLQLGNLGYPILGDRKYTERKAKTEILAGQGQKMQQLALCSYRLTFLHPVTGEETDVRISPKNVIFADCLNLDNPHVIA